MSSESTRDNRAFASQEGFVTFMAECWPHVDLCLAIVEDFRATGDAGRYRLNCPALEAAEDAEAKAEVFEKMASLLRCSATILRASDSTVFQLIDGGKD